MKVVVGSSDLVLSGDVVSLIASLFASTNAPIAFRGNRDHEPASPVERAVATMGHELAHPVICYEPALGGRSATFNRDYSLVSTADQVLAFFSTDREMSGGTGHVVKAALDLGIEVEAYTVSPEGELEYLGSDEGDPGRHQRSNPILERMWREEVRDE